MNRNYFYVILGIAAICLVLIIYSIVRGNTEYAPPPRHVNFPVAPFKTYIAGVGIVEAGSGDFELGAQNDRRVEKINVHVGQEVKKGDTLIELHNGDLKAEMQVQKLALQNAQINAQKLRSYPRKTDLETAEANLHSARIEMENAEHQAEQVKGLEQSRALSLQQINSILSNAKLARSKYQAAEAEYRKVEEGTWQPELEQGQLQVETAQANYDRIKAELNRTIVRAPISGQILQINTHIGEYPNNPILVMGDTRQLNVKVAINQFDAHKFRKDAQAVAYVQGEPNPEFELEFVRLDPFLVPKKNLTNAITEIVDTKVLHVIYRIKNPDKMLYVGQPMDIFIETGSTQ